MELIQLTVNDGADIYNMLQCIGKSENAFNNEVHGMTYEEYKNWLIKQEHWSKGEELPPGYVVQWTYWLFDESVPVGYGKLRSSVTEQSRKFGGNIGFAVVPLYRGKGYGAILFKMLLDMAREKGIDELISTVEKYNYASKIVHEKNGGILIDETDTRWIFSFSD